MNSYSECATLKTSIIDVDTRRIIEDRKLKRNSVPSNLTIQIIYELLVKETLPMACDFIDQPKTLVICDAFKLRIKDCESEDGMEQLIFKRKNNLKLQKVHFAKNMTITLDYQAIKCLTIYLQQCLFTIALVFSV